MHKCYSYSFNKEDKCSIYRVEGIRKQSFRLPPPPATSLQITARYLVIQIRLAMEDTPTITITLGDDSGNHFNFAFSTVIRKVRPSSSQMCALISLTLPKNLWMNVCFDLQEIAATYWPSGSFIVLDSIEVSPTCSIRNIYATTDPLDPSANGTDLPKGYEFPSSLASRNLLVPEKLLLSDARSSKKSKIPMRVSSSFPRASGTLAPDQPPKPSTVSQPKPSRIPQANINMSVDSNIIPTPTELKEPPTYEPVYPSNDEEEESDDDAFNGIAPSIPTDINLLDIKSELPQDEEEELELIYIDSIGCYYCPSNQQYYQLDNIPKDTDF